MWVISAFLSFLAGCCVGYLSKNCVGNVEKTPITNTVNVKCYSGGVLITEEVAKGAAQNSNSLDIYTVSGEIVTVYGDCVLRKAQ